MTKQVVFAADIGGTRTKYGLIDIQSGDLIASAVEATTLTSLSAMTSAAALVLVSLCSQSGINPSYIKGGALGIPGYIDGDAISSVWETMHFMEGSGFRAAMENTLHIPVRLENDARVVAMGEAHFGGHGSAGRLLSLTLGTGLGVVLVVDGHLQEKNSITHMAGHIAIRPVSERCYCGMSGCLEQLVSADTLSNAFSGRHRATQESSGTKSVFSAVSDGDAFAIEIVNQFLNDLVIGLNSYMNVYAPTVIVLGGGTSNALAPYLQQINHGKVVRPYDGYQVQVVLSALRENAGLFGAASLWKD